MSNYWPLKKVNVTVECNDVIIKQEYQTISYKRKNIGKEIKVEWSVMSMLGHEKHKKLSTPSMINHMEVEMYKSKGSKSKKI